MIDGYKKRGRWGACIALVAFLIEFIGYGFRPNPLRLEVIVGGVVLMMLAWGFSVWNYTRAKGYSYGVAAVVTIFLAPGTLVLLFLSNLNKVGVGGRRARLEEERRKALGY